MNKIVGFIVFFSLVVSVLIGLHLYMGYRLGVLFGFSFSQYWLVFLVLAFFFPLMSVAERFYSSIVTRFIYTGSAVLLGTAFILLCLLFIQHMLSLLLYLPKIGSGIAVIIIALILVAISVNNASYPRVKTITIPTTKVNHTVTLVQLSDIHIGSIYNKAYLSKIVKQVNKLNPDVVVITGDLFDGTSKINESAINPLNSIVAQTYLSIGNHELYEGMTFVMQAMKATKVKVLRNEVVTYKNMQFIGIDYPTDETQSGNPVLKTLTINQSMPSILLYHPPSGIIDAVKANITLQLSGHTHNGQMYPLNYIVKLFFPYSIGLKKVKNTYFYTTPGTGTWGPPMRLGSQNEITVIKLVPAK